jgi:hypothetical protein
MKNLFLLVALSVFMCVGCSDNKSTDCSEVNCTKEFVTIPITVIYEDGSMVELDSYEVKEVETGIVRDVWDSVEEFHTCVIASDLDREDFYNKKVKLQLIGKIAGEVVVQEEYTVTADCCHVCLLEGNKTVTIKR